MYISLLLMTLLLDCWIHYSSESGRPSNSHARSPQLLGSGTVRNRAAQWEVSEEAKLHLYLQCSPPPQFHLRSSDFRFLYNHWSLVPKMGTTGLRNWQLLQVEGLKHTYTWTWKVDSFIILYTLKFLNDIAELNIF